MKPQEKPSTRARHQRDETRFPRTTPSKAFHTSLWNEYHTKITQTHTRTHKYYASFSASFSSLFVLLCRVLLVPQIEDMLRPAGGKVRPSCAAVSALAYAARFSSADLTLSLAFTTASPCQFIATRAQGPKPFPEARPFRAHGAVFV